MYGNKEGNWMRRNEKNEKGQVMIIVVVVLTVLLGFTALTVDGGTGYVAKSKLQNAVDAAALAGAQQLPNNTTQAIADAKVYAQKNGIDLAKDNVTFSIENDDHSIKVAVQRTLPTYFARIFGKNSTIVSADATGTAGYAASVPWIVPFAIPRPVEFNYDNTYVLRMYGGGPYPEGYKYPKDYQNAYPEYTNISDYNVYKTNTEVQLKNEPSRDNPNPSNIGKKIPENKEVEYISNKKVEYWVGWKRYVQEWLKVRYDGKTGWAKREDFDRIEREGQVYPYHFDYMNVFITASSDTDDYYRWLKEGYNEKFTIGNDMYYMSPSSGGKTAWDAFGWRDQGTNDYTKAKIGDKRLILIPVVDELLPRKDYGNKKGPAMPIVGFVGFYIQDVHKNKYGTSAWFEGRFIEDLKINTADLTIDPDADFGIHVVKLTE